MKQRAIIITLFGDPLKDRHETHCSPLERYQHRQMHLSSWGHTRLGRWGMLFQLSFCLLRASVHLLRNCTSQLWDCTRTAFLGCSLEVRHDSVLALYLVAVLSLNEGKLDYFTLLQWFLWVLPVVPLMSSNSCSWQSLPSLACVHL